MAETVSHLESASLPEINTVYTEVAETPRYGSVTFAGRAQRLWRGVAAYSRRVGGGSLLVSVLIHVGLLLLAALIIQTTIHSPAVDFLPGGGSKKGAEAEKQLDTLVQARHMHRQVKTTPVQRVVSLNANAAIQLPDLPLQEIELPTLSTGLGTSQMKAGGFGQSGFGGGSGPGMGIGGLKGTSFFGFNSAPAGHVLFILDFSNSMRPNQMDLVVSEMEKTLSALTPLTHYQVILFAGGARYAGKEWKLEKEPGQQPHEIFFINRGRKHRFHTPNGSASNWAYEGTDAELPKDLWLRATSSQVKETLEDLRRKERWYGTDWRWPFKMAFNMKPAPAIIYFMTDGTGGADVDLILKYKAEQKATSTVNTFLMHTSAGANQMQRLAEGTKGKFQIVLNDGLSIPGADHFRDPAQTQKRLADAGKK